MDPQIGSPFLYASFPAVVVLTAVFTAVIASIGARLARHRTAT